MRGKLDLEGRRAHGEANALGIRETEVQACRNHKNTYMLQGTEQGVPARRGRRGRAGYFVAIMRGLATQMAPMPQATCIG